MVKAQKQKFGKRVRKGPIALVGILAVCFAMASGRSAEEPVKAVTYNVYCVTEACRKAADAEAAATEAAEAAQANANSLSSTIAALNAEINALEAQIKANEAIAEDLAGQIAETEQKLAKQRAALAELLVEMHFESDSDPIKILASSESISDLAEKQAREEVVKKQVAASSEQIKKMKEELEAQKAAVEKLIQESEAKKSEIAARRREQEAMRAEYQMAATESAAQAAEARKIKQQEIWDEIARNNRGGEISYDGLNSYYYRKTCPGYLDVWTVNWYGSPYRCECTDYAGWKMYEYTGYSVRNVMSLPGASSIVANVIGYTSSTFGDAKYWAKAAEALGDAYVSQLGFKFMVTTTPVANSIAVQTGGSSTGHVAWVESVNANGTINITEYNNKYSSASGRWGDFGSRINVPASSFQKYISFVKV